MTEPITTRHKLNEIRRELAQRRRVYPRLVADGRLPQAQADRQTRVLEAIARDYEADLEAEQWQGKLL